MGTLLIVVLMLGISISTGFKISQDTVEAGDVEYVTMGYETQASGDFVYHKRLVIASSFIDNALYNFPVTIHDNTGNLSSILSNASDIAFYAVGNSTQYNHEIDTYNSTSGELWAHVNITTVSPSADTIFYMYYDDSDGNYPVGHNPEDVWNSNYIMVQHLNDNTTSTTDDSTSNNYDGTKAGANEPIEYAIGKIGKCQNFDGGNDMINCTDTDELDGSATASMMGWFYADSLSADAYHVTASKTEDVSHDFMFGLLPTSTRAALNVGNGANGLAYNNSQPCAVNNKSWVHWAATFDGGEAEASRVKMYINGSEIGYAYENIPATLDVNSAPFRIGSDADPNGANWSGYLDETQVCSIALNSSWVGATYDSQNETTGFMTYGVQEGGGGGGASVYSLKGLTSDRVTFAGVAGATVYCNTSGDGNEWMEINMSINSTDNVTEIRVFMDDLNDTGAYINASNITMYVSSDNNSANYGEMGTFTDGGSNCSKAINSTNWNAGTMGANPFLGAGLTDKNVSIYCIFKVTIPSGSPTDDFYSSASDSCKVAIGHKT